MRYIDLLMYRFVKLLKRLYTKLGTVPYIVWALFVCSVMYAVLCALWPEVQAAAYMERGYDALGGELVLWVVPPLLMLLVDIRRYDRRKRLED